MDLQKTTSGDLTCSVNTILSLARIIDRRRSLLSEFNKAPVCSFDLVLSNCMEQKNGIGRKDLDTAFLDQHVKKVEIQEICFPAGQTAPRHLHPCPVVGYIKSGAVLFQIEGQDPVILREGDSFYEPKNVNILHFDNASMEQPMSFIAFYLKTDDEANVRLIP